MDPLAIDEAIFEKDDESIPGMDDPNKALIDEVYENIKKGEDHLYQWRQMAREAYDFYAGDQWNAEDQQKLNEENRPTIVFNRIPRTINSIAGLEVENRQELIFTPRENGDALASEVLTGAAQWVRDNCDAADEEAQSFKDALITGLGWTETKLDYEVDPDGAILVERIDPLEMIYDPSSNKRNLDDARWIARKRIYTKKEFKALWPKANLQLGSDDEDPRGMQPHDATLAPWYKIDQSGNDHRDYDKVVVIQYQCWIRETYYRVQDDLGAITELSAEEYSDIKDMLEMRGFKVLKQTRRRYKQYFIAAHQILEKGDCPVNAFTLRAITGMLDRNLNIWFGMLKIMTDPQRWANKWLSQAMDIFNKNAKGGYFIESGALKNPRDAEQTIAQANITYLNEGGLAQVKEKQTPSFPTALDSLLQYAVGAVSDLVGVNLEMMGMANRNQAIGLEQERKQAGVTIVADFFDGFRRYRKEQGRVLAEFIIEYISDGRLIRISGEGLGKYVPLVKKDLNFSYDIVIDDTPSTVHQRERIFMVLMQLMPQLVQAGIPVTPELLEYAPLPAHLIYEWKKLITNKQPDPKAQAQDQLRFMLAQQELMTKQAQEQETKSKTALNAAKAVHEATLSDLDLAKANHQNTLSTIETGLKLVQGL